jgi:hypothetical protein
VSGNELSEYRCETCNYAHVKTIEYDDYPDFKETYCDVLECNVDIFCCRGQEELSTFKILGCASHSALKDKLNAVELVIKAIETWWSSYCPVSKPRDLKPKSHKVQHSHCVKLHHHSIKRKIFVKYHKLLEMALTEDGRKQLTEFINNPQNKSDKVKGQLMESFAVLKKMEAESTEH